MRILKLAALAALFLMPLNTVNAGVFESLLSFDGVEDLMIDQSRSRFEDVGPAGFSMGDVLYGYVSIDQVDTSNDGIGVVNTPPDAIVVAFAAQVDSVNMNGSLELVTSTTAGFTLADLIDPAIYGNLTNTGESIFVVMDATAPADNPLDESVFDELSDFNAATGYEYVLSGGIAGGTDDFFQFFANAAPVGPVGFEAGGFSVFDSRFGGDLLPVSADRLDGDPATMHDIALLNGIINNAPASSVWDFTDNSDFLINAVPEPGTAISFLAIFGLGLGARRRKQK